MDARDLPSLQSLKARRLARIAVLVLAAMLALGLWSGYGALLSGGDVR